jgi:two-component system phosphate regulon response regulator PhoB
MRESILIVDDEPDLRRLLVFNLRDAGYEPNAVSTAAQAVAAVKGTPPALVILDVMLPDMSGVDVCRMLRGDPVIGDVPILMVSARGDEDAKVRGFEAGADDYVVKPFGLPELLMRVRALLRRATERADARATPETGTRLRWRDLEIDVLHHRVYVAGKEVLLRPLEFRLATTFLENPGVVLTRTRLLDQVWGIFEDRGTRTVDAHVQRLRQKLGAQGEAIETVHGFGYRLASEHPSS